MKLGGSLSCWFTLSFLKWYVNNLFLCACWLVYGQIMSHGPNSPLAEMAFPQWHHCLFFLDLLITSWALPFNIPVRAHSFKGQEFTNRKSSVFGHYRHFVLNYLNVHHDYSILEVWKDFIRTKKGAGGTLYIFKAEWLCLVKI